MTEFYRGKKVLITGHTGFKGAWLTGILVRAGAEVCGYSRCSEKQESLFALSGVEKDIAHVKGDVRDSVQRYIFDTIKRNPMILPIIVEI